MEHSVFLAQLLGTIYLAIGIGMYLQPARYQRLVKEMMASDMVMYFGGVMALIAGMLILSVNNVWEQSYVGLITFLGWSAVIKGVVLLVNPDALKGMSDWMMKNNMQMYKTIILVLGAIFAYYGYLA
jgi:uncharacterized membrane protein